MKGAAVYLGLVVGFGLFPAASLHAQVQEFHLPSGLRCVLMEKHDQPLVRFEIVTRWSPSEEPARNPGLAGFLPAVLRAGGAGPYTRAEFNRTLDDLGVKFTFEARRYGYRWTLVADSRSQEPALEMLANAVFRPVFDVPMVEAHRQVLAKQGKNTPLWDTGENQFLWNLKDAATEPPPSLEGLQATSFADLQAFRQRVVRPEASTLVIHGDLSLTQAKELVYLHFGLWGPGPQAPLGTPAQDAGTGPKLLVVLDESSDAELWAGRESSQCPPAVAELLGLLLEQVPSVAAPGIIRACSMGQGQPLLIKLKAGTGSRDSLVEAFLETLEHLRGKGFSAKDVERACERWKARMAALPLHPRDLVRRYQDGVMTPDFQSQVEGVRVKDINDALASMLAPGSLRFLLLGGDAALLKEVEKAGLGPATQLKPKD